MIVLVCLMHILFATIFPIERVAVIHAQPIFFTAIRMLIAGTILLSIGYACGLIRNTQEKVTKKEILLLFLFSLFAIFFTNVLECWSLQFVPSAQAAFIYLLSPFVSALLSYILFAEQFTLTKIIGMCIALLGFLCILIPDWRAEVGSGGFTVFSYGELALVGAAIATVIGWTAARILMRETNYTSLEINGISMVWGGLFAIIVSLLFESWHPLPIVHITPFVYCLALSIFLTNLLAFVLYGFLIKTYTITFLSFACFIEPIASALLGWFFLGEQVSYYFYIASLLVFSGLYIFYKQELHQGYIIKESKQKNDAQ